MSASPARSKKDWIGTCAIIFGALGGWLGLIFGIIGLCSSRDRFVRKNCKIGIGLFFGWIILLGFILFSESV